MSYTELPVDIMPGDTGHDGHHDRVHRRINAVLTPFEAPFNAVGDGIADDGTALNDFFAYITANDVGEADATGTFKSSVPVVFGAGLAPGSFTKTKRVVGRLNLVMSGSGRMAMTVKNMPQGGYFEEIVVTGTGSGSNYASRTWETGIYLTGCSRTSFRRLEAQVFAFGGVVVDPLTNGNLSDFGEIKAVDCGSGAVDTGEQLQATWSNPVRSGSTGSTAQRTTINVNVLPPSYVGSAEYGAVGTPPYMVRITELDGTKRLHFIYAVNSGAGTIDVFPWIKADAPPGTLDYIWGGGLVLAGSDNNVDRLSELYALRCSIGLNAGSLYGPVATNLLLNRCGIGQVFGARPGSASYGHAILGDYFEGNGYDTVWMGAATNTWARILGDYGMDLSKCVVLLAPRNTDDTFATGLGALLNGSFTQNGRSHSFEKRPYNASLTNITFDIDRPDMVVPLLYDTATIRTSLDLELHRLVGYDTCRVILVGTGSNGTPTGTVTFAVPLGHAANVTNKALTSNVATLTTDLAHGFKVGMTVVVAGVDGTFDGTYVITAVPTTTSFSYALVAADVPSTADTGTATHNWTLNGGNASVAFSGFASGKPAEFIVRYNTVTFNCQVLLMAGPTVLDPSIYSGIDLTRTTQSFATRRATAVAAAMVDARAYFTPVIIAAGGKIGAVRVRTTVAATGGGGSCHIGIYASAAGRPVGNALFDFGAVDLTTAAGILTATATSGTLAAGLYFLCITTFGYTTQATVYMQDAVWPFLDVPGNIVGGGVGFYQTITSGALPAVGTLNDSLSQLPTFSLDPHA